MLLVGIRELRTHLSHYLKRVAAGEEVIVTDRGEQVAALVPVSREQRLITELQKKGIVSGKPGKPGGLRGVEIKGGPISDTVLRHRR